MANFLSRLSEAFNDITGKPNAEMSEAEKLLLRFEIPYKAYKDGSIFVPGNVNLTQFYPGLDQLPDLSNVYVAGDFYCNALGLKNLKGSPAYVGGDFNCKQNPLENLKGGPAHVVGRYDCGGMFTLKSLEGRPYENGYGVFYFRHMHQFETDKDDMVIGKSLDRTPEEVQNAKQAYDAMTQTKAFKKVQSAPRPPSFADKAAFIGGYYDPPSKHKGKLVLKEEVKAQLQRDIKFLQGIPYNKQ